MSEAKPREWTLFNGHTGESRDFISGPSKVLLIAWGELEAGCKEAEQVDQMIEKIREARK